MRVRPAGAWPPPAVSHRPDGREGSPNPPSPTRPPPLPAPAIYTAASGAASLACSGGCGAHPHARKRGERQPQVQ